MLQMTLIGVACIYTSTVSEWCVSGIGIVYIAFFVIEFTIYKRSQIFWFSNVVTRKPRIRMLSVPIDMDTTTPSHPTRSILQSDP